MKKRHHTTLSGNMKSQLYQIPNENTTNNVRYHNLDEITIIIQKVPIKSTSNNADNIFVNKEAMYKASKNLSYNEFKIYMYMIASQDGYEFLLSTKDIADKTNTSQQNIQDAINGLIKKRYFVEENKNIYSFFENPNK